jgi:hypothetical protein
VTTDGRVIDFDAFRNEQRGKPVELRIGDKTYELPPDLPATVALDVIRMQRDAGPEGEVTPMALVAIGEGLFGSADKFREIVQEHGLSTTEMGALIRETLGAYNQAVTPPNRETRRAKRAARSG